MTHVPRLVSACASLALLAFGSVACDRAARVGPDAPSEAMGKSSMPSPSEAKKLARSSNAFGFDLYARARSTPGNLAMSPASISAALAMTFGGARGQTEAQMRSVMHLEGARDAAMSDWGALARSLTDKSRGLDLRIANRLFGEKTYTLEQPYLDQTRAAFGAPLEALDFKTAFEPARAHINGWVEDHTEKRIKDLLPPGALDGDTRLVLANAIYFLADWTEKFDKRLTSDAPFVPSGAPAKPTPTMHRTADLRVTQGDGVKVLELPYKGDAAMLVVLPDANDGLAAVESSLSTAKLEAWARALASREVDVSLPRFEVSPTPSMSLGPLLVELGMPDAFDREKADFTGIAAPADPRERLTIAKVFHKAFVKVDEKGTEAAAATAVVMAKGGGPAPAPPFEFRADHPFLFVIVDQPTGMVLFLGRVADPTIR